VTKVVSIVFVRFRAPLVGSSGKTTRMGGANEKTLADLRTKHS
jgi:hypothetical protein